MFGSSNISPLNGQPPVETPKNIGNSGPKDENKLPPHGKLGAIYDVVKLMLTGTTNSLSHISQKMTSFAKGITDFFTSERKVVEPPPPSAAESHI